MSSLYKAQHKQNASDLEQWEKHSREEEKDEKTTSKPVQKDKRENQCTETGREDAKDTRYMRLNYRANGELAGC